MKVLAVEPISNEFPAGVERQAGGNVRGGAASCLAPDCRAVAVEAGDKNVRTAQRRPGAAARIDAARKRSGDDDTRCIRAGRYA